MLKSLKNFTSDVEGSVLILTGALFPVLIAFVGMGLDFGLAFHKRQQLQAALDSAALTAVSEANIAYKNIEDIDLKKEIKAAGEAAFKAGASTIPGINLGSLSARQETAGNYLKTIMTAHASYPTHFLRIVGFNQIDILVTSEASIEYSSFKNFNFLFDVSASMGIGATHADQQIIAGVANCAFTCHLLQENEDSSYLKARAKGAEMRIDVARSAVMDALDILKDNRVQPSQFTAGAHIFDNDFVTIADSSASYSDDLDQIAELINKKVYMKYTGGGTNIELALSKIADRLPASGNGQDANSREQYVIVLSDGVENELAAYKKDGTNFYWIEHDDAIVNEPSTPAPYSFGANYALNEKACDKLKDKNIIVMFLHTEYLRPITGIISHKDDARFNFVDSSVTPIVPDRFKACAGSASRVVKASSPDEIRDALNDILANLTSPIHRN